jgi:cytochrome c oxidase subunit 3
MATTFRRKSALAFETREKEAPLADHGGGNGFHGGNFESRHYDPDDEQSPKDRRREIPSEIYRTGMLVGIGSVVSLFATLTAILQIRWVHSKAWAPLALPHILYLNTFLILLSSLTMELAQRSLHREMPRRAILWLGATLALGAAFVEGQVSAWKELVGRGVYLASNPSSFFFYLITATHGIHLLGGIIGLSVVMALFRFLAKKKMRKTAVGVLALYWHFMDGLWIYVLVLLLVTVQRG